MPSVKNGIKGKPLCVEVEKHFNEDGVRYQGTWFQLRPKYDHLATFEQNSVIHSLLLKETVQRIVPPNISLNITCLDETDEGVYQLTITIIHPGQNTSKTVTKTVRITVDGKNDCTSLNWLCQILTLHTQNVFYKSIT